jgi:hypothetical protein
LFWSIRHQSGIFDEEGVHVITTNQIFRQILPRKIDKKNNTHSTRYFIVIINSINLNRILIIFTAFTLASCGRTYEIREPTRAWQPYQEGDVLVFESTTGQTDSIFVQKIETYTNPDDHLDLFPTKFQTMFVSGEMTLRTPFVNTIGQLVTKEHITLIEISSGKKNDRLLLTIHRPRDTTDFPTTVLQVPELDSIETHSIKSEKFTIEAKEYFNLPNSDDLKTYIWNKKLGYLGYELENGEVCTLTEFWRDGKNLLE